MTGTIVEGADVSPTSDVSQIKDWLRQSKKNLFGKSKISSEECGKKVLELLAKRANPTRVSIWKSLGDSETGKVLKLFKSAELSDELLNFVKAHGQRDVELMTKSLSDEEWDLVAEVVCTKNANQRKDIKQHSQEVHNIIIKKMERSLDNKTHLASAIHFIETLFNQPDSSSVDTASLGDTDLANEKLIDTVLALEEAELKELLKSDADKLIARINKETSGFYRILLRTYIEYILDRAKYFGDVLMKDSSLPTLSRIIIARAEYDLLDIKEYLDKKGSQSLADMINSHQSVKPLLSQIAKTV